jgi:hypothetical protein
MLPTTMGRVVRIYLVKTHLIAAKIFITFAHIFIHYTMKYLTASNINAWTTIKSFMVLFCAVEFAVVAMHFFVAIKK